MKKPKILVILLLISILFIFGCNQTTKYVCPDGSVVSEKDECNNLEEEKIELSEADYMFEINKIVTESINVEKEFQKGIIDFTETLPTKASANDFLIKIEEFLDKQNKFMERIQEEFWDF